MEQNSSTVKFVIKSPRKQSVKLRRQKSVEDVWSTARRRSFREKLGLDIRKVQSLNMGTSRKRKVLYMPRSKMKIIMITLSSPEKTPSPDIFTGFDVDVKGSDFKKLCSPKNFEKSIKLFFDTSKDPINAEVIVKEDKKVVETFSINELLDIQDNTPKSIHGKQINLTASQPKWSPDIRIYDHDSGYLCKRELSFLQKRKMYIQTNLRKLFDDDEEIYSRQNSVPHIALMGSGGGYRAMIAMSGIVNALYDEGLLDYIMYTSALSGSSWYIATLYSHPEWPNINPREVQKKLQTDISKNPKTLSNLLYYAWDYFITRKLWKQEWNFTTHVFGPMLGQALISDRIKTRWSEQADRMSEGTVPLPLLAAIHAKDNKGNAKEFHEWVEFSPYEVTIPKYGAAIDMKLLGSEFTKGVLTRRNKELPLYEIMSICGSAFTITLDELRNKESKNFIKQKISKPAKKVPDHNNQEEYDQLDGICLDRFDHKSNKPSQEVSWDVLDGAFNTPTRCIESEIEKSEEKLDEDEENKSELTDDVLKDLNDSFTTICQILEDDEPFENIEKSQQSTNDEHDGCLSSSGDDNCFVENNAGTDELDGCLTDIKDAIKSKFKERWISNDRKERAAFVNNFMRNVSFDEPETPTRIKQGALFENYLKTDIKKLCLIDAGLAFNSPYPLLFQPGRDIDLILSFDFTDRKKDSNSPFKTLLAAEQWAIAHDIKFPNIASNVDKYDGKDVQELYIFEDDSDPECPIIMHFVLVNNDFRKYKKPGQKRDPSEHRFADFNIYDDQSTFHMQNFHYSEENFYRLSQLSEFIVLNNVGKIKECIRISTQKKIDRLKFHARKRHPTT